MQCTHVGDYRLTESAVVRCGRGAQRRKRRGWGRGTVREEDVGRRMGYGEYTTWVAARSISLGSTAVPPM